MRRGKEIGVCREVISQEAMGTSWNDSNSSERQEKGVTSGGETPAGVVRRRCRPPAPADVQTPRTRPGAARPGGMRCEQGVGPISEVPYELKSLCDLMLHGEHPPLC